jgi:nicotinate-nucleotide adenylyltransferase
VTPARPVIPGSIGVLGGTFDPIHIGHLAVAEEAREALGLERILFMPAAVPPHKTDRSITPAEHRAEMVARAIADHPAFELSTIELGRDGPSYTVDTIEALVRDHGVREPVLILSVEEFRAFHTWRSPDRILELARLAVAPRGGFPDASAESFEVHLPGRSDRVEFLAGPRLGLSATELRARAAAGRSLRYLVPDAVAAYIGDHALYMDLTWRNDRT